MQSRDECRKIHEEFYFMNPDARPTFQESILGRDSSYYETLVICSPYTERKLKPFIRRDTKSMTPKMKLIWELKQYHEYKARGGKKKSSEGRSSFFMELNKGRGRNSRNSEPPPPARPPSIDYCYLNLSHLHQVNTLLRKIFWPGIDVSSHVLTPEHTVVVLYRRLVIGCGFITPDGYITYVAVDPEWQGIGIGTFILYHLIQTCPDKDITLHASVNNPSVFLYNKFGFKPEEYIIGFYQKYLPKNSDLDTTAFLLRLRR
eukprot:TRINITY_DN3721_c1_g2_i2.p1 TRINITY_DN3721_c1_g2~~TRINITY_DN3721_c1_g2_i2.p1  ORF type:complete len:260 (+),score=19.90 TRINITY_DN3721_c1_g2_i2:221-1000(+)